MTSGIGFVSSLNVRLELSTTFTSQTISKKRHSALPVVAATRRSRLIPIVATTETGVRELSAEQVEATVTASARPILFVASATWCGPCQFLAPELEALSKVYNDAVDIVKMDTDKYPDMASAMLVRGLPSLYFIKDSQLLYKMEGALPAEKLEQLINFFFFNGPRPQELVQSDPNPQ